MEFFTKIATFLQELNKKQFQQYLAILIGSICLLVGGISYWVFQQSNDLLLEIKKIEKVANKSINLLAEYEHTRQEEKRVLELFDKNKDFTIQSFFETFCKDQGISPENGWAARIEETNDRYDEASLSATFKEQTTENIIKILVALDKNDMVYTKELRLKNEGLKKITFEITLATKKIKGFEQTGL